MKIPKTILLLLFTSGLALAAPPQNHRSDRYRDLYLKSPITDPLIPPIKEEEPTDLPDWVLVAVGKNVNGATEVHLMNIKDRSRIKIPSDPATEAGFSIVKVVNGRNYLKDSVVTVKKGRDTGEVRFDPKFLVLKTVSAPSGVNGQRASGAQKKTSSRTGIQPPTPPGVRTSNSSKTGSKAPTKPGSVPRPTSSSTSANSTKTSTSSKRTRYVPRPKK